MRPHMFSYGSSGDRTLQVFWGMCERGKAGGGLAWCLLGEQPRQGCTAAQRIHQRAPGTSDQSRLTTPGLFKSPFARLDLFLLALGVGCFPRGSPGAELGGRRDLLPQFPFTCPPTSEVESVRGRPELIHAACCTPAEPSPLSAQAVNSAIRVQG